jgi:hypothetical protein
MWHQRERRRTERAARARERRGTPVPATPTSLSLSLTLSLSFHSTSRTFQRFAVKSNAMMTEMAKKSEKKNGRVQGRRSVAPCLFSSLQQRGRHARALILSDLSLPFPSSGAQKQAELGKTAEGFAETFKAEV